MVKCMRKRRMVAALREGPEPNASRLYCGLTAALAGAGPKHCDLHCVILGIRSIDVSQQRGPMETPSQHRGGAWQ
ncbi:protein of unknown function (plasmid) [Cupriavidus taiwanensis]|uniref:Uncharacterized protein n=1 Tax=Cupriavidus taiwanensis TaxID=164546 RepID=A0A375FM28_9BURK|nr:protein of unknown function [Cupriavidus taiwanensis]SOZ72479.1 protein of unknown function [Cupriavidus taiwanensis]SOZ74909.1 protein of unknown function [Cupriavidus taiwanensis]SPA11709.1 protein of unknown function [Cupriavidus taiwanensis]SPA57609.1 protein of unknown function [Cupriavidus taiwanensis]